MKIFTVLSAVIFATFVVAGPIKESNTEHGNQVEERQCNTGLTYISKLSWYKHQWRLGENSGM
ncbi:hypothetical protein BDV29DRAFT_174613 [Aspergillus leporis]|uniref:Uncharacterized protein n=1 Tax=Aspergillus leporis TaxID=41062 RepID=A0A5N5X1U6_9EURO|nr:hypothetical protein BDV29DRAFT_174613 [Aspergillus leporis]